ncbi:hypothetical protein [Mastigocladopsis repens]|uniref:hypothetical protein n=1 Tax=Mastigocladopsis repens TaxID=221287 RepID=UPI00030BD296|nr:hypothetical protein [Mastigocladopsis repens]
MTYQSNEQILQQIINKIPPTGIRSAAESIPVTIAPDGAANALLGQIKDKIPNLPMGVNTPSNSISVTLSPTGALVSSFGLTTDAPSNSDTGTVSFLAFFKYFLQRFSLFVDGISVEGNANILNAAAIPSTDVHVYNTAVIQITTSGIFIGAFTIQGSNDQANWYNLVFEDLTSSQSSASRLTSASAAGLYNVPRLAKFIRVILTSVTSGGIAAKMIAKK